MSHGHVTGKAYLLLSKSGYRATPKTPKTGTWDGQAPKIHLLHIWLYCDVNMELHNKVSKKAYCRVSWSNHLQPVKMENRGCISDTWQGWHFVFLIYYISLYFPKFPQQRCIVLVIRKYKVKDQKAKSARN